MRLRLVLSALTAAALAATSAAFVVPVASAQAPASLTYTWSGRLMHHHADNHSWTDPRNWSPTGVPGDGDVVSIVSPQSGPCNVHVDEVPTGLALGGMLLSTNITPGCHASISGGSITINGFFGWTGGTIDTPITIGDGSGSQIGDEPVRVIERLMQPLVVLDGSLMLASAHMRFLDGGNLITGDTSFLTVSASSEITGTACCGDLPRVVNRGQLNIFSSTLALDSVAFDQSGEIDLDAGSALVTTHGSVRSRDGASYGGPGGVTMSNGTSAVFTGRQVLSAGVGLELGNDGTEGSTLDGVTELSGDGTLDWTGGTIGAQITLDPGVGLHAYGESTGVGRRALSGLDTRHGTHRHSLVSHGPVVVDDGATLTMRHHAQLTVDAPGSLTLAPGTTVTGTSGGRGDVIQTVGATISVPSADGDGVPVLLDNVGYVVDGGQTDVAPGSALTVAGAIRGRLSQTGLTGGGTLSIASPMDVVSGFTFADASRLRLLAGGSLDGTAVYVDDGSFDWLGGSMSGNDIAFDLNDMTVGGATRKTIGDDHGFTSFVQVVNPVTFTSGAKSQPNLLDMGGNSFQSFQSCTVHGRVELRDGDFVSSSGALVFDDDGPGTIVLDADAQLFSSGPLSVVGGVLVSRGQLMINGGDVDIRAGATLRLPDPSRPLLLQGGSFTGQGVVDGDVLNSAAVFDPLESGADGPLTITGSYTQTEGGRLVLDLAGEADPVVFGGAVTIAGTVTYNNLTGYSPAFGDELVPLRAGQAFTWAPTCEETTGTRSATGHWHGERDQRSLLVTFEKGASGSCEG